MQLNRGSGNHRLYILMIVIILMLVHSESARADPPTYAKAGTPAYVIDFSTYRGGPVDKWLETRNYKFEKDAKNRQLLGLSINAGILEIEAKGRMSGFILNDSVNLANVQTVKIKVIIP